MLSRGSGILLHVSSLPSGYGVGDLGPSAHQFAGMLNAAGQRYWQFLPLNPTDGVYGESPYSSPSAFACNPLFISPEFLYDAGFLLKKDIAPRQTFPSDRVDFSLVKSHKADIFAKAFDRFMDQPADHQEEYHAYCEQESAWLNDYALFMVFKDLYAGKRWDEWPNDVRSRKPSALRDATKKYARQLAYIKFLQYAFSRQWNALRDHCREMKVQLIGDIPIYVNEDSVDVWANPEFFKLDSQRRPQYVAGVPPDYFSTTGQRWGNPVYDWDQLKKNQYDWWMKRLARQFELFDVVRIDHFRGLEMYWEIPASEATAVNGHWANGPKDEFFEILSQRLPGLPIIGEDLGIITDDVTRLMQRFQIPGMKVLQFAFSGDMKVHPYIPENYVDNCVVYTGTHDNNTTRGWFGHDTSDEERRNLAIYLGKTPQEHEIAWDLIRVAWTSRAVLAIVPLQDVLNLGQEARMNVPGTAQHNWRWRHSGDIPESVVGQLRALTEQTSRLSR